MIKKRIVSFLFISIFLLTISHVNAQTKKAVPVKSAAKVSAADIELGKQLLSKSDCLACHRVDIKLVGPSYADVAKKYPATDANYTYLANRIKQGGSGVWGQIAMSPHPSISLSEAKKIAAYILSVK